jgi:hypothetical protein
MFPRSARLARAKNAAALLKESLSRRVGQELVAFEHQRRSDGFFSAAMGRYLARRAASLLGDAVKKLRSPEKTLVAPE